VGRIKIGSKHPSGVSEEKVRAFWGDDAPVQAAE
jgi:hypothetical protein